MSLYVARAAVRIVRPQLRRNATSAARLGILLCADVAHAARLAVAHALWLGHTAPSVILGRVGDAAGGAAGAGGARTLSVVVARASVVALLLAPAADVRQNDRVHLALGAPAVCDKGDVAWVVAHRHAGVTIVRPENGGARVPAAGAAVGVLARELGFAAVVAGGAVVGCRVGAVHFGAEVDVGRHFVRCMETRR